MPFRKPPATAAVSSPFAPPAAGSMVTTRCWRLDTSGLTLLARLTLKVQSLLMEMSFRCVSSMPRVTLSGNLSPAARKLTSWCAFSG